MYTTLHVYVMHLILGHTFYTDFVCEFTVNFEIFYYFLQLNVDTFYFILYSRMMVTCTGEACSSW
jgi:hypothetical protein